MSQVDARSFLDRLATDETLLRATTAALSAGAEATTASLIDIGRSQGLAFTEAELVAAWKERPPKAEAELSDEQLNAVAGGNYAGMEDISMEKQQRMQMYMEPFNQTAAMISNILRKSSQTSSDILKNLK